MSILPLPPIAQTQLRSSLQIYTLVDVVEELVRNSLDAAATSVQIEVDFSKGYCSVSDDGVGIPANEFREGANLARFGCTSKHDSRHGYGRRGCFLADLSSLSLVSICSRHKGARTAGLVIGVLSGVPSRQQCVGNDDYIGSHGTKVVVHNLFGNLPVRFKHFARRYAQSNGERRVFHDLKRRMVGYLLAYGQPVNIRLRNRNGNLVYTHGATRNIDRTLSASSFDLENIQDIFRQADLGPNSGNPAWKLASAQAGDISIQTATCLLPSPSRYGQFIAIGHQPVSASGQLSCLYDTINQVFDLSEFSALLDDECKTTPSGASLVPEYKQSQLRHRMVKGVDRWPRFYVRIDIKSSTVLDKPCGAKADAVQTPTPIVTVVGLLKSLFTTFLESQNLKGKAQRAQRNNDKPPTYAVRSARNPAASSLFHNWKRVKHSASYADPGTNHRMPFSSQSEPCTSETALSEDACLLLTDIEFDSGASSSLQDSDCCHGDQIATARPRGEKILEADNTIQWTDPRTNKVMRVNACNGFVLPERPSTWLPNLGTKEAPPPILRKKAQRLEYLKSTRSALAGRLKQWPTVVYQSTRERPIQSINHSCEAQCARTEPFSEPVVNLDIAAKDLANATVLGQIDAKFILAVIQQDEEAPPALLMVDQHAADERIKVEDLFIQLTAPEIVKLAVPLGFEVSAEEQNRLLELQDYFAGWAIKFDIDRCNERIRVTHLPAMIAERCRLKPRLMIELLRKEVWSRDNVQPHSSLSPLSSCSVHTGNDDGWISKLSPCPKGLVEMANSRACRTAIRFNDVLSKKQCQDLLCQLSTCRLPFQCAHGRPSMTLLASVGSFHAVNTSGGGDEDFGTAYRKWCESMR